MKKIMVSCGFMIIMYAVILTAYDISSWYPYGNDVNVTLNYQTSKNEFILGVANSVNLGSCEQPIITDLDGDGTEEYFVFTPNRLTIYTSNLTYITEYVTGMTNSTIGYFTAVADFNSSNPYKEIQVIDAPSSNYSDIYFESYVYNGVSVSLQKSIRLGDKVRSVQRMRCIDYDKDGDTDCLFVGNYRFNTSGALFGIDSSTTDYSNMPFNIVTGAGITTNTGAFNPVDITDYNFDGKLEAVMFHNKFSVFNQTSEYTSIVGSRTDGKVYQSGSGDMDWISIVKYPPQYFVSFRGFDGTVLDTSDGMISSAMYSSRYGLAITSVTKGDIYALGIDQDGAVGGDVNISVMDYQGNIKARARIPGPQYSYYIYTPFTIADLMGGSDLEIITSIGVYSSSTGVKYYSTIGGDGWCVPIDYDSDTRLELLCRNATHTLTMDEEGVGGGLENHKPVIYSVVLDKYGVKTNEPISVTINANDYEDEAIFYAIDCDYDGAESSLFAVPLLNQFSCQYEYNGTKQVRVYANDLYHGGSSADISTWTYSSVSILVGDSGKITPCFSPFMLCDNFNYPMPLIINNWYVTSSMVLGLDSQVVPIDNRVKLPETDMYYLGKYYNTHKYGIITAVFNASFNTSGHDALEFTIGNSNNPTDTNSVQVLIRFAQNKIYSVYLESSNASINQIGTYSDNTLNNYKIQVFYDEYKNFGNTSYPRLRNTYDIYKSGILLAKGRPFYHGLTPSIYHPNVTDDFSSYSDYITFTSEYTNLTLDDVYVYKGTDTALDTLIILDNPQVVEEWSGINEYVGCIVVKGEPSLIGQFDCNYKAMKCQECCGYVNGKFQVVKTSCALTKAGRQYANKFQKWVFKNIWIFMIGVFAVVIYFMMTRPRRRN
jgi:hypothetical protein